MTEGGLFLPRFLDIFETQRCTRGITKATVYSGHGTNYNVTGTLYRYDIVRIHTINNIWAKFMINRKGTRYQRTRS